MELAQPIWNIKKIIVAAYLYLIKIGGLCVNDSY